MRNSGVEPGASNRARHHTITTPRGNEMTETITAADATDIKKADAVAYRCPQCAGLNTKVVNFYSHLVACNDCTEIQKIIEVCTGAQTAYQMTQPTWTRRFGAQGFRFTMPGWCAQHSCDRRASGGVLNETYEVNGQTFNANRHNIGKEFCKLHHEANKTARDKARQVKRDAAYTEKREAIDARDARYNAVLDRCEAGEGTADDWKLIRGTIRFGYSRY